MNTAHVLLVDDNEEVLHLISDSLLKSGLQVIAARDGREALKHLETGWPELILSDVMMPRMTGYELCRHVRSKGQDTPFLLMSALGSPTERIIGLRLGADDYLVKPVDPEELLLKIRKQIARNKKQERQLLWNHIQERGEQLSILGAVTLVSPDLKEKTAQILSLVETHHSLSRVLDASPFTDIDTLRILYALLQMGVLDATPDRLRAPEA